MALPASVEVTNDAAQSIPAALLLNSTLVKPPLSAACALASAASRLPVSPVFSNFAQVFSTLAQNLPAAACFVPTQTSAGSGFGFLLLASAALVPSPRVIPRTAITSARGRARPGVVVMCAYLSEGSLCAARGEVNVFRNEVLARCV